VIRVLCPHCKRRYRTVTEVMGRQAVCHNCHVVFVIGQERPPFSWKPTDLAEDSWIGVEPPSEKEELKHCIMCDAPLPPGTVRCPACGANQVTGVVHRQRAVDTPEKKTSFWHLLPWRYLIVAGAIALISLVTYWVVTALHRQAAQVGDELLDQNVVNTAARFLREAGDDYDFANRFANQITDENQERFVPRLSAGDPVIRRAVILLIGHGRLRQVGPIVAAAESGETAATAREVLQTIGPRRLAELSCDEREEVRVSAAKALRLLLNLPGDEATLQSLAEAIPIENKIAKLNQMCRPWPQATGSFVAVIKEQRCPSALRIEQVGRTFYMRIGMLEFRSRPDGSRLFEIPVEHWCAATGQAVDVARLRQLIAGMVTIESPYGAGWSGTVHLTVKQPVLTELPGFLPITPPDRGQTVEVPVTLERTGP